MPNWDHVFDTIRGLRASRPVAFREATDYQLASGVVTYASTQIVPAKVHWRNDAAVFARGVWQEADQATLVVWAKDLTGNATLAEAETVDWIRRLKGRVQEGGREAWSRFDVDGQALKARAVYPLERPDGKVYALRVVLEAAD